MARVRLFASLREIAGTGSFDTQGTTVGDVLSEAADRYGERFAAGLETSKVWVNGEPVGRDATVGHNDELAVIPPVSGGFEALAEASARTEALPIAAVVIALVAANVWLSSSWFVALLVGVVGFWAADLVAETNQGGFPVQLPPVLASALAGAFAATGTAADGNGFLGLGVAAVLAVLLSLIWSVIVAEARDFVVLAGTTVIAFVAAVATASLTVLSLVAGPRVIGIFLVQVVFAAALTWLAVRIAVLDPFIAGSIGAVIAGAAAAYFWELDVVVYLLVGAAVALALIAGRGFGGMCRTGEIYLVDRPPGRMPDLDGPIMAAAVFLPILLLVT